MYAAKGRLMRKTKREKIDVEILRSIEEQLRKVGGGDPFLSPPGAPRTQISLIITA